MGLESQKFSHRERVKKGAEAKKMHEATSGISVRHELVGRLSSLAEVTQDEEKQALLGKLITARAPDQAFADRALNKLYSKERADTWTDEELAFLNATVVELNDRLKLAESVEKHVTQDAVEYLRATHHDFALFARLVASDRATELVRRQLKDLAMTNPEALRAALEAQKKIEKIQKSSEYRMNERQYDLYKRRFRFEDDEIAAIIAHPDPESRAKAAYELRKKRQSKFVKALDWATGVRLNVLLPSVRVEGGDVDADAGVLARARQWVDGMQIHADGEFKVNLRRGRTLTHVNAGRAAEHFAEHSSAPVMDKLKEQENAIGDMFALMTTRDPVFMKAVMVEAAGTGGPVSRQKLEGGVSTREQLQERAESITPKKINAYFRAQCDDAAAELFNGKNWHDLTSPEDKNRVRDVLLDRYEREHAPTGSGWFNLILKSIFGRLFANYRENKHLVMPDFPRPKGKKKNS